MHARAVARRALALVAASALMACGGIAPAQGGGDAGADAFSAHPPCASADAVRLCGAGCPDLPAPLCPGLGCTPALDRDTDVPSAAGVCWSDPEDKATWPCAVCADGDACIERAPGELVCVSAHVCEALWDLGVRHVCRYADKSAYTHMPLPDPSGPCPGGLVHVLCGGACGTCPDGVHCTGRSPGRPFGICGVAGNSVRDPEQPSSYTTCALSDSGYSYPCPSPIYPLACAVFAVSPVDQPVAKRYGTCLSPDLCLQARAVLPSGLDCYDTNGALLP